MDDYHSTIGDRAKLEIHPTQKILAFLVPLQYISTEDETFTDLWTYDMLYFDLQCYNILGLNEDVIITDINEIINPTQSEYSNKSLEPMELIREQAKSLCDIHYSNDIYFLTTIMSNYQSALKLLLELDNFDKCFKENNIYALSLIHKKLELFELLVDIKKPDPSELQMSLIVAACYGMNDILSYILSYGTTVNFLNNSALSIATLCGHSTTIKLLLDYGSKMNSVDSLSMERESLTEIIFPNDTFACAIYNNNIEILQLYVDLGYDLHQTCELSLVIASNYNRIDALKFLISHGIDHHCKKDIAFVVACSSYHIDIINYLLELGIDDPDTYGQTLSFLCTGFKKRPIQFLLEHTKKIGLLETVNYNAGTPLKNVIKSIANCIQDTSLYHGYRIDENGMYYNYVLTKSISIAKCADIIHLLTKYDVDISNHLDKLYLIVSTGRIDLVKLFVEAGADIHHEELYVLLNVIMTGDVTIMEYLIECGIDIHLNSENALYLAYRINNQKMIDCLISAGADVENPIVKRNNQDCIRKRMYYKESYRRPLRPTIDISSGVNDTNWSFNFDDDVIGL